MKESSKTWILFSLLLIVIAAGARLIPHPYNFSPVGGMILFSGAVFGAFRFGWVLPLMAMILSDLILGIHSEMPWVYGALAANFLLARQMLPRERRWTPVRLGSTSLMASTLFFVISNFGVWFQGSLYPKTFAGWVECYVAAIPFFGGTVVGDLLYTALFFGLALLWRRQVVAKESA